MGGGAGRGRGGVDGQLLVVYVNLAMYAFCFQMQQLGYDNVGYIVIDRRTQKNYSVLQQS